MLMDRFPQASCTMWLMNRVDPASGVGACSSTCPSGAQGGWPLHRMFAMSPNPGWGVCGGTMVPSVKVSILGLEVASKLELWVAAGEPGTESLVLLLCWFFSAWRWALFWLQWLWLQQWCCSSPKLWGDKSHRDYWSGRVDLCPTWRHLSCSSLCFHNFPYFSQRHWRQSFLWGLPYILFFSLVVW